MSMLARSCQVLLMFHLALSGSWFKFSNLVFHVFFREQTAWRMQTITATKLQYLSTYSTRAVLRLEKYSGLTFLTWLLRACCACLLPRPEETDDSTCQIRQTQRRTVTIFDAVKPFQAEPRWYPWDLAVPANTAVPSSTSVCQPYHINWHWYIWSKFRH